MTLSHPRTSTRGAALWEREHRTRLDATFVVTQLAVTGFDGTRWQTVDAFPLGRTDGDGGSSR